MSEDRFLELLRDDARQLRYDIGSVASNRLGARIRARIAEPTVSQLLASWFRPLAASLSALALAAVIGVNLVERNQSVSLGDPIEYSIAGDVYSVGE